MLNKEIIQLSHKLHAKFNDSDLTLSTAESCTGGMLSSAITDISGISSYFMGGVISYSNESKKIFLAVSEDSLKSHGAVSQAVCEQMALGIAQKLNTTHSVAITGIAGPTGGSKEKPVGTVWICIYAKTKLSSQLFHFNGDRELIRQSSVIAAYKMLLNC